MILQPHADWKIAISHPPIGPSEVHIWRAQLANASSHALSQILSPPRADLGRAFPLCLRQQTLYHGVWPHANQFINTGEMDTKHFRELEVHSVPHDHVLHVRDHAPTDAEKLREILDRA